jgi:DNA-binding MarR family transcriptional regulator
VTDSPARIGVAVSPGLVGVRAIQAERLDLGKDAEQRRPILKQAGEHGLAAFQLRLHQGKCGEAGSSESAPYPDRTRRMSSLAEWAKVSLSHLSRIVNRLEHRGLVRREPDPTDGRFSNAILTDQGFQTIADTGHVAHVRSIVIDVLSPEQLRRLGRDADRILSRIDRSRINSC